MSTMTTATTTETTPANRKSKQTDNTIFVRFLPPSALLRRHHLEQHFSQIGPIKKASLIIPRKSAGDDDDNNNKEQPINKSSYGFVKYTCAEDAQAAAQQLEQSTLQLPPNERMPGEPSSFTVRVELASVAQPQQQEKQQHKNKQSHHPQQQDEPNQSIVALDANRKAHCRVILRNLSFYAKESHIEAAMKAFGDVVDVHLPKVTTGDSTMHRGFAFVTFAQPKQAQQAIQNGNSVQIKHRPVKVEFSVSKRAHQQQQQQMEEEKKRKQEQEEKEEEDNDSSSSEGDSDGEKNSDSEDDAGDKEKDDDDDSDSENQLEQEEDHDDHKHDKDDSNVTEQRALFVRNLPFDGNRHDVFETFRKYGKIAAIHLVTDPGTGMPRGTAFVTYDKHAGANRAWKAANNNSTDGGDSSANNNATTNNNVLMKGRRLIVDWAVDRETAQTLKRDPANDAEKKGYKDRRNVYLKGEGRVDDEDAWAALGERDKNKRQKAWADKIQKLKSPLFFINPHRLSIRNLAKHVDEAQLKQLLFQATLRGLKKRSATVEDQLAHWRALGEMTPRELMEEARALKASQKAADNPLNPAMLDEKNIKQTIPSIFLERDVELLQQKGGGSKASSAPSRGFAFAEFVHHVHALACLRELNNNPAYSHEFAAGGKAVAAATDAAKQRTKKRRKGPADEDDERLKIPRLIVEFTVENKAKARKQAENRAHQQANKQKQKSEQREKKELAAASGAGEDVGSKTTKSKKRSRGAIQREKKRLRHEEGGESNDTSPRQAFKQQAMQPETEEKAIPPKPKGIKPPKKKMKKRQREEADEKFTKMVDKYREAFSGKTTVGDEGADAGASSSVAQKKALADGKRWFE